MKEMVGGCCVCSDERGWPENPLVYCDGQNCTVAVHQACYGIVTVPTGPWYCRKCESQERPARVRCELCPSRDGALKRTDNQGWAHVVCALYIPEVRFGNVTTMEPIILQLIPSERYAKTCYICQEIGKPNRANVGACMQCNKFNCKQQFHVTCAQSLGLLCEEAGNYLDNVKYCGYCQHHYSKLKKGGNVKTIPPYKPITHDSSGSDSGSSPEKEIDSTVSATASSTSATSIKITNASGSSSASTSGTIGISSTKQRKSSIASKQSSLSSSSSAVTPSVTNNLSGTNAIVPGNSGMCTLGVPSSSNESTSISGGSNASMNLNTNVKPNNNFGSSKEKDKHSKNLNKISSSKDKDKEFSSSSSSSSREKGSKYKTKDFGEHGSGGTGVSVAAGGGSTGGQNLANVAGRSGMGMDITLSSTDNVFPTAEAVSNSTSSSVPMKNSGTSIAKKRKAESKAGIFGDANDINHSFRDIIKDVSVTLTPLPLDKTSDLGEVEKLSKKQRTELSPPTHQSTEPSIPNVSPKHLPSTKNHSHSSGSASQTQNVPPVESSISSSTNPSSSSSGSHKTAKERDERVRSSSPFTSTVSSVGGTTVTAGNTTAGAAPSLYVSVPLSTANVPGLNLPTTTTADHPTPSQSTRAATQQQQQSTVTERQSPRIHHQISASPVISEQGSFSSSLPSPVNAAVLQSGKSPSPSITGGNLTATTTETGNLKISFEKQNSRVAQLQEQESAPGRRSRTPDSGIFSSSFNISGSSQNSLPGATSSANIGLKFSYEAQPGVATAAVPSNMDANPANNTAFKDSPPSSPGSEAGSARKRGRKSNEIKDVKVFQNGGCAVSTPVTTPTPASTSNGPIHATHMLGNQLNPTSSVAQKLTDQLHMEMQDHSVYTESQPPQFVGVPFPSKPVNNVRNPTSMPNSANSLASMFGGNGGGYAPQSLEQLLERQWEQGSQFLMEQAQHFDIASLLSCLHQLQTENVRLEEHVNSLIARRDHLLAVNARLAIPLNANVPQSQVNLNNIHINGPTQPDVAAAGSTMQPTASVPSTGSGNVTPTVATLTSNNRAPRSNAATSSQMPTMENGIDFRHSSIQQPTSIPAPTAAPAAPLPQSTSGVGLRHSSSVHPNYSTTNPSSSASHHSNHQHHQLQSHQHHNQQQQQPSLAQHNTMSSSASNTNSVMTSASVSRQTQQQAQPPPHHHPPQPQHPHQQTHHPQHHSHHAQQQHQQQQQQQQQSLHTHHQHTQHQPHPLVQHTHNHHHPSSTGPAAPHHIQQQPSQHHQMSIASSDSSMRNTGTGGNSGTGRAGNNSGGGGVGASQMLPGRPVHGDNSAYHPVYSHQSQLRRDDSQGKTS
ncbi:protein AF-10 isoform X5 [Episyrphus balteatus]|uniref:protein AF-10 isoform X5 n=1 Tax=Episyrphus balteatus TaxID=286459 RepID=UPI00248695E0|nr:protein AF-10 isoform X5 [Episyrphus balteatus]